MRQDKERSIREQADLWKGYWCILACILLVGRVSYLTFFQNHIVSVYAAAQTEQKEDSSVQILQENLKCWMRLWMIMFFLSEKH